MLLFAHAPIHEIEGIVAGKESIPHPEEEVDGANGPKQPAFRHGEDDIPFFPLYKGVQKPDSTFTRGLYNLSLVFGEPYERDWIR